MNKTNKIDYGDWEKVKFNFVKDFYRFKIFLQAKDSDMAKMTIETFRDRIATLMEVSNKMHEEYEIEFNRKLK